MTSRLSICGERSTTPKILLVLARGRRAERPQYCNDVMPSPRLDYLHSKINLHVGFTKRKDASK